MIKAAETGNRRSRFYRATRILRSLITLTRPSVIKGMFFVANGRVGLDCLRSIACCGSWLYRL